MQRAQFLGDSPYARFGHTITPITKDRAILFGGAVGDTGKYVITGDTFICDYNHRKWKKLESHGNPPSNRAAHASVAIEHFLFVLGGALGGGELADDSLYQLDFLTLTDKAYWSIKNTKGTSPGGRYGHVMAYLKPFLILYGGNTGSEAVGDIWKIDVTGNCIWERVITPGENPPPRVYHSASICRTGTANGMMVIFGGRGSDQIPLNDAWGLRKHRDGRLDWMKAPYKNTSRPAERYQHRSLFVGTLLLIIGGRNNQVGEPMALDIYDTDSSDWYKLPSISRFRHVAFMIDHDIFVHGGFDQDTPNVPTDSIIKIDLNRIFAPHPLLYKGLAFQLGKDIFNPIHQGKLKTSNHQEQRKHDELRYSTSHESRKGVEKMEIEHYENSRRSIQTNHSVRLCPYAFVENLSQSQEMTKVHIDMLPVEHKRLVGNTSVSNNREHLDKIYKFFLNSLFLRSTPHITYPLPAEYIDKLLDAVEKLVEEEPTLVRMRSPVKIFGDIHGQINEVNRFFETFGSPSDETPNGDIEYTNYLFLGDYVDRGNKSIQTLLLLFALKIKFPQNVVLLRGSHQDRTINKRMGFGDECTTKLKENIEDSYSFFSRVNRIFQKMPIGALVEGEIFCCHGGIGQTLKSLDELNKIDRPIRINHQPKTRNEKIVYELLWSDPCRNNEPDFSPNIQHDYFKTKSNPKFSDSRANNFCNDNDLAVIVRSAEPFIQGFQFKESIVTIFSCSDYGGENNKASILHILKTQEMVPKILQPVSAKDRWLNISGRGSSLEDQHLRSLNFTPPKQ